jgi:hypothetical protein
VYMITKPNSGQGPIKGRKAIDKWINISIFNECQESLWL